MRIKHQIVVFDAPDLTVESEFWAGVLGGTVDVDDNWHQVSVGGEPRVAVQLVPDHTPPEWPDGTPQQLHLDLWVDDFDEAHEQVMQLGATVLRPYGFDPHAPDAFQVYADPAGHPFCLCWIPEEAG